MLIWLRSTSLSKWQRRNWQRSSDPAMKSILRNRFIRGKPKQRIWQYEILLKQAFARCLQLTNKTWVLMNQSTKKGKKRKPRFESKGKLILKMGSSRPMIWQKTKKKQAVQKSRKRPAKWPKNKRKREKWREKTELSSCKMLWKLLWEKISMRMKGMKFKKKGR